MNWAPYAVYNPQLWHWPETWPLVSLSPTVEPFVVIGYVMFYLAPFFPAIWILRRIQRRGRSTRSSGGIRWSAWACSIFVIGFVYDAILEISWCGRGCTSTPRSSRSARSSPGKPYQFPLMWESSLVTLVMIPAGVLLYRDDTGRTVAEKLAQRIRLVLPGPSGARHVRGDVPHPQRRLPLPLRRRLRRHPGERGGHLGGVSVSVSRGEGLRPAGPLRKGGSTRPVLGGHLGRLGDGSVRPACRAPSRTPRTLQPVVHSG